jgi:hypothetical protein
MARSFQASKLKIRIHFSYIPRVHAPPISPSFINSINYEPPHYSSLRPPNISSLFGPNILLNSLFSNTLSLLSSLTARDQVIHTYKTAGKIENLYILIFTILARRREDKIFVTEW